MNDKLPENARYVAIIKPDDEDLRTFFQLIKKQLQDYPDRPLVAIVLREMPE
jgi:hypothetical protein